MKTFRLITAAAIIAFCATPAKAEIEIPVEYQQCINAAGGDMLAAYPETPSEQVMAYASAECYGVIDDADAEKINAVVLAFMLKFRGK